MDELFGLLLLLAVPAAIIWLLIRQGRLKAERNRLLKERAELLREKEELARENLLLETHHLKFQMQPHALNNVLTDLKLIAVKLGRGMDALSSTLEYILYKGQLNLVSVEEEIGFVRRYLDLNELFRKEVDGVHLDETAVNKSVPQYHQQCIPHLVTGYLLENAFKHGHVEHPEFLRVTMKLDARMFQMHVANKVRPKPSQGPGGIGLMNMEKRLRRLMPDKARVDTRQEGEIYHAILTIQF